MTHSVPVPRVLDMDQPPPSGTIVIGGLLTGHLERDAAGAIVLSAAGRELVAAAEARGVPPEVYFTTHARPAPGP